MMTAWHCISPEVLVEGFKRCCVSYAVDEADDILRNGSEEAGSVRS